MITPRSRFSSDQRNTWAPILYLGLQTVTFTLSRLLILWTLHLSNAIRSCHFSARVASLSHITWRSCNEWVNALYSLTSSANNFVHTDVPNRILSISFINNRNRVGLEHYLEEHHLLYVQFQTWIQICLQLGFYLTGMLWYSNKSPQIP